MTRRLLTFLFALALVLPLAAQQSAQQPPQQSGPAVNPSPANPPTEEFLRTADQLLLDMSKRIALPAKTPLKKSIRSREEIRQYVLRRLKEEQKPEEIYAEQKTLEKLGLIPAGFPLESFLVDLLTEQIQGLYDPQDREFFIADWIPLDDQRVVMAHELVHALQDQHFGLDAWMKAVKDDDDASLARSAVAEGSAMAAMLEYLMNIPARDLPDLSVLLGSSNFADPQTSPLMAKAPLFIQDSLLFPYTAGAVFTQRVLKNGNGWPDFQKVFQNPPVSSQQVLHPDLYFKGVAPAAVSLPLPKSLTTAPWNKLDENILGEFGLHAVLKQQLGQERALRISPLWFGDRYVLLENTRTKDALLIVRLRLKDTESAALFFGPMSEALELKYEKRTALFRRPNFFQFSTPAEGSNFLYCVAAECLLVEGADRKLFDAIIRTQNWPLPPAPATRKPAPKTAAIPAGAYARRITISVLSSRLTPPLQNACMSATHARTSPAALPPCADPAARFSRASPYSVSPVPCASVTPSVYSTRLSPAPSFTCCTA